jgi:hypothetical protein
MRRILFVLTVAALMAAMMLTAGPAQANNLNFGNSSNFVQVGNGLFGFGAIDDDDFDFDDFDFGRHHHCCHHLFGNNDIDFDGIDFGNNFGHNGIIFSGIDQDSRSGDITIG